MSYIIGDDQVIEAMKQFALYTDEARQVPMLPQYIHLNKLNIISFLLKGNAAYLKKNLLWMKTIHYLNTIRSHLVTIVPMAPFTPKSTSKLRSALHIRFSKVSPRFISRANTAQT